MSSIGYSAEGIGVSGDFKGSEGTEKIGGSAFELQDLRKRIDYIDDKILALFLERLEVAQDIAKYKKQNSLPITHGNREQGILDRLCSQCDENIGHYVKVLYNTIFDVSRTHQRTFVESEVDILAGVNVFSNETLLPSHAAVVCQGLEGAYSQMAALRLFEKPNIRFCDTFEDVFVAVENRQCDYGVLPIENSCTGSIIQVYELMKKHKVHIVYSVKLPINHTLLSKSESLDQIAEVYSHEQAIKQCDKFLKDNPQIKVNVCPNTALAAKIASESSPSVGSISSGDCASLYGLNSVASDIQNDKNSHTRFICISSGVQILEGASKISFVIGLSDTAGSLYRVLSNFSILNLNLLKLELRPKGTNFESIFYFDIEGSLRDKRLYNMLSNIAHSVPFFALLGNYKEI